MKFKVGDRVFLDPNKAKHYIKIELDILKDLGRSPFIISESFIIKDVQAIKLIGNEKWVFVAKDFLFFTDEMKKKLEENASIWDLMAK